MSEFLKSVADKLIEQFGNNLSGITVVMPSNRARIFLDKHLCGYKVISEEFPKTLSHKTRSSKPILSPKYTNITGLFEMASDAVIMNSPVQKISLVWELYNAYKSVCESDESFDEFYFFGEILLSDFNDIDSYLVSVDTIFTNLEELEQITDTTFLTEEQKEILQRLLNFKGDTKLKENFRNIWSNLKKIYNKFNAQLAEKECPWASEGQMLRSVIEKIKTSENEVLDCFPAQKYVFVNCSHLNKAEKELLNFLEKKDKALVWNDTEEQPNKKKINFIESPNAASQTSYIANWLHNLKNPNFENADTAIILCDEALLPVVLTSLPEEKEYAPNIAINYSVAQSNIASSLFLSLDSCVDSPKVYDTSEKALDFLNADLEKINLDEISNLEKASFICISQMLKKMSSIVRYLDKPKIFSQLVKKLVFSLKIPYHGEPAQGLQVMAISDTRSMDFANVLILSANEGIMPKISAGDSFIPPLIRKYFQMNTIDTQDKQNSENFFKLLEHSQNISIAYSTGNQTLGKGEMSRYLLQMLIAPDKYDITINSLKSKQIEAPASLEINPVKTRESLNKLIEQYNNRPLSPSAFNNYIDCNLQFYFKYVEGIKAEDKKELNQAVLGTVLHKTMEFIYKDQVKIEEQFFNNGNASESRVQQCIEQAFNSEFFEKVFEKKIAKSDYNGEQIIYFNVIDKMVNNTLAYDRTCVPFEIIKTEGSYSCEVNIDCVGAAGTKIKVGGYIDRIDRQKDGTLRVVDYKTGKLPDEKDYSETIQDFFNEWRPKKAGYQFQAFLYSYILSRQKEFAGEKKIAPALLFTFAANPDYNPVLALEFKKEEFENEFIKKLRELFDINIPFNQCKKEDHCKYCDYKGICDRGGEE
ncbi:hypothetical protein AGMMS49938_09410 [Fibrobacterales bacterium]|nr:hypothetical protein AGMMS49938_09410 [Fibrobacterales bacterium]